jgi:hypothetical protein
MGQKRTLKAATTMSAWCQEADMLTVGINVGKRN